MLGPFAMLGWAATTWSAALGAESGLSLPAAQARRFVEALNDRGYSDWALDYIELGRQSPETPADVKAMLELEEGPAMAAAASRTTDLAQRSRLYEEAALRLNDFVKSHEGTPLGVAGLRQQSRVLVEAGHLAELRSLDAKFPDEAKRLQEEARTLLRRAADGFARAEGPLKATYLAMPKSLSDDDPMRQARDQALVDWVDARLQQALVDYEEAQTHPMGSRPREIALDRARNRFEVIADEHRNQMAGVVARMWQGKCYEERNGPGDLGRAMGIYDELKDEPDPRLRPLLRQVAYFRIILMGKRHDYALAQAEAERWLKEEGRDRQNDEALGVLVELGRDLLGQAHALPEGDADGPAPAPAEVAANDPDRTATIRRASEALKEVTKVSSRHKRAAILLLRQTKSAAEAKGGQPVNPTTLRPEEALSQAEGLLQAGGYDQAISLLRVALRKFDPGKDQDRINTARGLLAFALYSHKEYAAADVVAEHLARNYPKDEQAKRVIEIALASLGAAFNESPAAERAAEADRLASLAAFTAQTMPDTEPADVAKVTLGEIEMSRRHFDDAAKALESLRAASPRRPDALAKAGKARYLRSQELKDKPTEAQAEVDRSIALFRQAVQLRQDAKTPPTDPALVTTTTDLAEILLAQDKPQDALTLLDPLVKAATGKPSAEEADLRARLVSTHLRALIANKNIDGAVAQMKALQASGGSGQGMVNLFFGLGRLLEQQVADLKAKGDQAALQQTQTTYAQFLDAMAANTDGQSYQSLEWAGESLLSLGQAAKAASIFERVLKTYSNDAAFLAEPDAQARLQRARFMEIQALIGAKQFDQAQAMLDPLLTAKQKSLEVMVAQAQLYEARAQESGLDKAGWVKASSEWSRLATLLGRSAKLARSPEYFDAWYHVALCQSRQGRNSDAVKTLKAIMIQSRGVGSPEMKKRYDELLRDVSR